MVSKIYCLSGLGVDQRVFEQLELPGVELIAVPWIAPLRNETLEAYAARLFGRARLPEKYCIAGVSFGGMVAIEFARLRQPEKMLLISTVADISGLPFLFRLAGTLRLHRIVPVALLRRANFLTYRYFGAKTETDRRLLRQILRDTDPVFLKWALDAILRWKNKAIPAATVIHGSADRILPSPEEADYVVDGGGHFMIVTHARDVSAVIRDALGKN